MKPPTFQEFPIDQVINVKTVANVPVQGDGITDDTANINSVLLQSIGKVVYFPAGTYMVSDSLVIPPGSRIYGDAFASAISAVSSTKFLDPNAPTAMVKLGLPGDVGVGQIVDMLFTVSDILPGCKLVSKHLHELSLTLLLMHFPSSKSTWPAINLGMSLYGTLISVWEGPQDRESRLRVALLQISVWLLGVCSI